MGMLALLKAVMSKPFLSTAVTLKLSRDEKCYRDSFLSSLRRMAATAGSAVAFDAPALD